MVSGGIVRSGFGQRHIVRRNQSVGKIDMNDTRREQLLREGRQPVTMLFITV